MNATEALVRIRAIVVALEEDEERDARDVSGALDEIRGVCDRVPKVRENNQQPEEADHE